jgi:hypothetical protein
LGVGRFALATRAVSRPIGIGRSQIRAARELAGRKSERQILSAAQVGARAW